MSEAEATPLGTFPTGLHGSDAQLEPYDWFARRRAEGPVVYDPTRSCYDVFGYEAVKGVLGDHERFSSDPLTHPNNTEEELSIINASILYLDPPRHDQLRSVVDDFIYPGAIKELTPDIEGLANDLLEQVLREPGHTGEFDLVGGSPIHSR